MVRLCLYVLQTKMAQFVHIVNIWKYRFSILIQILFFEVLSPLCECHFPLNKTSLFGTISLFTSSWLLRHVKDEVEKKESYEVQELPLKRHFSLIFTFSSEKVLDLCKMWPPPPPFLSNVHVLRPSEPEKMVFTNVSVCLSVCMSVCLSVCRF